MKLLRVVMSVLGLGAGQVAAQDAEVYAVEDGQHKGSGVELHRPDGTTIFVNPAAIAFVREPLPGEVGNATITFSSGAKQATQESVQEIIEAVEKDRPEGR